MMIPKIIHFVWVDGPLPSSTISEEVVSRLRRWLKVNPDFDMVVWDDTTAKSLINYDLIERATSYAMVSDILRYSIIYQHGGYYFDTDFEPLKPLRMIPWKESRLICSSECDDPEYMTQAFFAAEKGHPVLRKCVEDIVHFDQEEHILLSTGPGFFSKRAVDCLVDITFVPRKFFYPFSYDKRGWYDGRGDSIRELFPQAFAAHLWEGSWLKKV